MMCSTRRVDNTDGSIQHSVSLKNYNHSLIKNQAVQTFSSALYNLNIFSYRSLAVLHLKNVELDKEKIIDSH